MEAIHVTVSLRASQKSRKKYEAVFLVDTGATDSMAPASKLRQAGISRSGRMTYELANGQTIEYDFGLAEIEFMGEITSGRIIFGPDDAEPLLGVTALESVGISVDPAGKSVLVPDARAGTLTAVPAAVPGQEVDESPLSVKTAVAFPAPSTTTWS